MKISESNEKIYFIYNANTGKANAILDYGKKYITPSKYDCQLCMVSYGPFGMKKDWKNFTKNLPYPVVFLHKNEIQDDLKVLDTSLPAVIVSNANNNYRVILDADDFEQITSLEQLKNAVFRGLESK